jgi:hypothetical protein
MKPSFRGSVLVGLMLFVLVGVPLGILTYQSYRTGMTWRQILRRSATRLGGESSGLKNMPRAVLPKGGSIDFLIPQPIGEDFQDPPRISHLEAVDLDRDGLLDVVVCDCQSNRVSWIRQYPAGTFAEHVCGDELMAPAHVQAADFDQDGDLDLMVAVLGLLFPSNDRIGSVVVLENTGQMEFRKHVVRERIARVSDVRAGDLDGDGDPDLAVAQFGYDDGQTRWIENLGGWQFKDHVLQELSGPIHCELTDADGDGDLDIISLVSQEWEEIYLFEGDGKGGFQPRRIFGSDNEDFGSSGISLCDLDQDGDVDVLYTNGDAFDYLPPVPRSWHGVQWLENRGNLDFRAARIADFHGAVNTQAVDVDHDGDLDIFVVSAYNYWEDPSSQSMIWLENDGQMRFSRHDLTNMPTHIQGLDQGDFNGDGEIDLVTGGLHTYAPYDRMERIVLWTNRWPGSSREPN